MHVDASLSWLVAVLLCALRLGALLLMSPLLMAAGLPARIKVLLTLALATCLVSGLHLQPTQMPTDLPPLLAAAVSELLLGALLAFGVFAAFAAFSFAGNLLDIQIGFNIANLYDPITHSHAPLIATLLSFTAVMVFYLSDVHHLLLRGFAYSLQRLPLGQFLSLPSPALLVSQFGKVFGFGLLIAAPLLFCLFLVEIGLAVLSRNLPQMNLFMLSPPIKIAIGLALLAFSMPHMAPLFKRVFDSLFGFWEAVLHG
ncbi:flagellar biosynthetic protein FliR [Chitinimonas sp.]|uniref:flagellar biosynthetic protein FliR n=1 Tax=Chitinimonas sp. TaxID=1934313 RepID=UPI0035B16CDD